MARVVTTSFTLMKMESGRFTMGANDVKNRYYFLYVDGDSVEYFFLPLVCDA
jgi:hypothetical protein